MSEHLAVKDWDLETGEDRSYCAECDEGCPCAEKRALVVEARKDALLKFMWHVYKQGRLFDQEIDVETWAMASRMVEHFLVHTTLDEDGEV